MTPAHPVSPLVDLARLARRQQPRGAPVVGGDRAIDHTIDHTIGPSQDPSLEVTTPFVRPARGTHPR